MQKYFSNPGKKQNIILCELAAVNRLQPQTYT